MSLLVGLAHAWGGGVTPAQLRQCTAAEINAMIMHLAQQSTQDTDEQG